MERSPCEAHAASWPTLYNFRTLSIHRDRLVRMFQTLSPVAMARDRIPSLARCKTLQARKLNERKQVEARLCLNHARLSV